MTATRNPPETPEEFRPLDPPAVAPDSSLRSLIRRYVTYGDTPRNEESAFRTYSQAVMVRWVRAASLVFVAGVVLAWPSDYLLYGDEPLVVETFRIWRVSIIVAGLLCFAVAGTGFARSRLFTAFVGAVYTAAIFVVAWTAGDLGGIDTPFFYFSFLVAGVFVLYLVDIYSRIALMGAGGATFLAAFFVHHPEHLSHPFLPSLLIIYVAGMALFVMVGPHHLPPAEGVLVRRAVARSGPRGLGAAAAGPRARADGRSGPGTRRARPGRWPAAGRQPRDRGTENGDRNPRRDQRPGPADGSARVRAGDRGARHPRQVDAASPAVHLCQLHRAGSRGPTTCSRPPQ